jgi:two-component system response regulator HupR/HoxA
MGRKLEGFTNAAMDRLTGYSWKGNVRELENEIERVTALAGNEERVSTEMLSEEVRGTSPRRPSLDLDGPAAIHDWNLARQVDGLKRHMILEALREAGSKTRAAERLGIPRQSLQKMMKRLELSDRDVKGGEG